MSDYVPVIADFTTCRLPKIGRLAKSPYAIPQRVQTLESNEGTGIMRQGQYVPTTEEVCSGFRGDPRKFEQAGEPIDAIGSNYGSKCYAAFHRWLAAHDAEVRDKALKPIRDIVKLESKIKKESDKNDKDNKNRQLERREGRRHAVRQRAQ